MMTSVEIYQPRVNITNYSSTVPYASYILKHFPPDFSLDIAKPRLQKNPHMIIFSLDDITSQLQKTKLCALPCIVNCYM